MLNEFEKANELIVFGPEVGFEFREDQHFIGINLKASKSGEVDEFLFGFIIVLVFAGGGFPMDFAIGGGDGVSGDDGIGEGGG